MKSRLKNKRLISYLELHSISKKQRAKAVDWMIEIHRIFNQSHETLFRSVYIMDLYLKKKKQVIDSSELHLICIVSIFISSKLNENQQIRMKDILQSIAKGKYTKQDIIKAEQNIFSLIFNEINLPTINSYFNNILQIVNVPEFVKADLKKNSEMLQKMFLYSYDILNVFTFDQLAVYSLVISIKLYEFNRRGFNAQKFTAKILKLIDDSKQNTIINLNILRNFASGFRNNFAFSSLPAN